MFALKLAVTTLVLALVACRTTPPHRISAPPISPERASPNHSRFVTFVGEPMRVAMMSPANGMRFVPALPAGLQIDERGAVTGSPGAPLTQTFHVYDGTSLRDVFSLEVIPAPDVDDLFVATTGDDNHPGSREQPVRTIGRALQRASAGTRIFLRGGDYDEDVRIGDLRGEPGRTVELRSYPGERVRIVGAREKLTWQRNAAPGAAPDEWISNETIARDRRDAVNRGVLGDGDPYVRLLTYARIEDLRAANQRWVMGNASIPGATTPKGDRIAWTYFGPGIWHDPETGRIHLRLSPTANGAAGGRDYAGPSEPSKIEISLWGRASTPLTITRSSHITIRDLTIMGGGDETLAITHAQSVLLDHVTILGSTMGLTVGASTGIRYVNGRMDGGIPLWSFRSDFKANYKIALPDGSRVENNLIRKTSRALLYVAPGVKDLEIAYSELENAHDIYMGGIDSELHHCRIRDIHDEALFISHIKDIANLRIHHNVIERVLSAVSGVGGQGSGPRYVYRNIIDLREPTAGFRPGASPRGMWRWGHVFKGAIGLAPLYFYHNTITGRSNKPGQPALLHYHELETDGLAKQARWFVNNYVVLGGGRDHGAAPFTFVPDHTYRRAVDTRGRALLFSDGNAWVRLSSSRAPLFRCFSGARGACAKKRWFGLSELRSSTGFERHSRSGTSAGFASMRSFDRSDARDDLRPGPQSTARGIAVPLPAELPDDREAGGDAGAFAADAPTLLVGVDGRLVY